MSGGLPEFLLARIAEDEKWIEVSSRQLPGHQNISPPQSADHVLRRCESDRRVVEAVRGWFADQGGDDPAGILRALALPYADRPGYREEWRP